MTSYGHITPAVRRGNILLALGLVGFVGGVYSYSVYYKYQTVRRAAVLPAPNPPPDKTARGTLPSRLPH
jgi:hypothetical protein